MLRRNTGLYIIVCIGILLFSGCGEASQDPCIKTANTILDKLSSDGQFDPDNTRRLHSNYCPENGLVDCLDLLNMILPPVGLSDEELQAWQENLQLIKDLVNHCKCPDLTQARHENKIRELCEKAAEKAAELNIQA